ncbi:MAG: chorion class high-cysteine HCB protein 13 [Lachnospiraceae bacterium]|nr:chorion class high-cysteine HCB protein 13 [Lachnospiraceae bacterium]MBQ8262583.1 chorion class high-cysteine HCB protein 13 [Lachnospiraceae bacterium]
MSDLSATQCGCQTSDYECGGNNWICIIIILFLLCNNSGNSGCGGGCGINLGNLFGNGSCCEWILIILVLLNCCGGRNNNSCF